MRIQKALLLFISALSCTAVPIGCSARHSQAGAPALAEKIYLPGVSDFGKVNEYLYHGAQPKSEGLEQLKRFHVDTIVDLRGELHGLIENERRRAESLGMRFVNIPGSGWATPKDTEIAQFFTLIQERPRRTIFIHCWLGRDRSSTFIAAYRIAFQHWTPQEAIQEMRTFHYLEFWHPNMRHWVEHFPERLAQSAELAPFRNIRQTEASDSAHSER